MGQEGSPPVSPVDALPTTAVSPSNAQQELLDRLRKMEQRLDQVTKQNEELSREVQELRSADRDRSQQFPPVPATRGPDIIAEINPPAATRAAVTRGFAPLVRARGVSGTSGPYPLAFTGLSSRGVDVRGHPAMTCCKKR